MGFGLSIINNTSLIQKQSAEQIMKTNDTASRYGLRLTEKQALELVESRDHFLRSSGRMEFGGGIIHKLIEAFCDSPYISQYNYEETIHDLLEAFYYYKNETNDAYSDDRLIEFMKKSFDGVCEGSIELLVGRELEKLSRLHRKSENSKPWEL